MGIIGGLNGSVGELDGHPMEGRKADYAEIFLYIQEFGSVVRAFFTFKRKAR